MVASQQANATRPADPEPLVSVVMATYRNDDPEFLRQAVESVLAQTHRALEFLVVLDGPIESDARAFLDETADADARLRIVPLETNRGPACARNAGIAAARGEFVAITDADDVSAPSRIERQLAFLRETGADVVGSWYRVIDETGAARRVKCTPGDVTRYLWLFNPLGNSTVFARAQVMKDHPYPEGYRSGTAAFDGEDYDLWVTLAIEGYRLRNMPDCLVDFRADRRFLERRRGVSPFRTDLKTKLRALALYPRRARPFYACAAAATAALRLLPAPCLAAAYAVRDRLRFRAATPPPAR